MTSFAAKTLLLLQLCLFFVGSIASENVSSLPPIPASGPARPPIDPFKKSIVVQGNIYRRFCDMALWRVEAVSGATVIMQCNITETPETYHALTDLKGFFHLKGPKSATILEASKCKVFLGPCPSDISCSKPSSDRGGASGVYLAMPQIFRNSFLFHVGPWVYEPKCP